MKYSKPWVSFELSKQLEPWAVRNASLITAVAPGYYEGVLQRNPHLRSSAVTAAMPYGFSSADFSASRVAAKPPTMFDPADGRLHFVYAGALLPKAHAVLERLLEGLSALRASRPAIGMRLRLHFIGTGKSPGDAQGFNVRPLAERLGLGGAVHEHPHRMGYLDVLTHLSKCHAPFIVGSTEAHYTPSKVFQSVSVAPTGPGATPRGEHGGRRARKKSRWDCGHNVRAPAAGGGGHSRRARACRHNALRPCERRLAGLRSVFRTESARVLATAMDVVMARWSWRREVKRAEACADRDGAVSQASTSVAPACPNSRARG